MVGSTQEWQSIAEQFSIRTRVLTRIGVVASCGFATPVCRIGCGTVTTVFVSSSGTTTPAGRFLFHVIAAMDEMTADLISEGTLEGLESAAHADESAGTQRTRPPCRRSRHARCTTKPTTTTNTATPSPRSFPLPRAEAGPCQ